MVNTPSSVSTQVRLSPQVPLATVAACTCTGDSAKHVTHSATAKIANTIHLFFISSPSFCKGKRTTPTFPQFLCLQEDSTILSNILQLKSHSPAAQNRQNRFHQHPKFKCPQDAKIPGLTAFIQKIRGFNGFSQYRLTKKETAFRLSLWWARRDLNPHVRSEH